VSFDTRRAYAKLLRKWVTGNITNDRYEDEYDEIVNKHGYDDAAHDMYTTMWFTYNDTNEHVLSQAARKDPEFRRRIARWLVFLYGDMQQYTWPAKLKPKFWRILFIGLLPMIVLGVMFFASTYTALIAGALVAGFVLWYLFFKILDINEPPAWLDYAINSQDEFYEIVQRLKYKNEIDAELYPFVSINDLSLARSNPRFLAGPQPA
jgi:hypothetical protein